MLNKSKVIILGFLFVFVFALLDPIDSNAAEYVFNSAHAEPSFGADCGYLNILVDNPYQGYILYTYVWNFELWGAVGNLNPSSSMDINVYESSVSITPFKTVEGTLTMFEMNSAGSAYLIQSGSSPSVHTARYNGTIVAISLKGNYGDLYTYFGNYIPQVTVVWNDEAQSVSKLANIANLINTLNTNLGGKLDYLVEDMNTLILEIDNVEEALNHIYHQLNDHLPIIEGLLEDSNEYLNSCLQELRIIIDGLEIIFEEQQKTNTWLEKIFNWLKDSPEQEKEAASNQANQSTSDAQDSIEDKSEGFIDSLGGLTNLLSTESTNASWTFPALYLPEIPGVMSRTQLTSEQPIDFGFWVNQIPTRILTIVRSLLTLGLIVYCFKEFYGVIEYLLTLRGGRNNE